MKNRMIVLLSMVAFSQLVCTARGGFPEAVRDALDAVAEEANEALAKSEVPRDRTIAILPVIGDDQLEAEGMLLQAMTTAGLDAVAARKDRVWEEIFAQVEWDERKEDMLDPATLAKFGQLKGTQLLMQAFLREADEDVRKAYVILELHIYNLETAQHLWGNRFSKRAYKDRPSPPGRIHEDLRTALQKAFAGAEGALPADLKGKTVMVVPLDYDQGRYATGLAKDFVTASQARSADRQAATLTEARRILKDDPDSADAILSGSVIDLYRQLQKRTFFGTTYENIAEVRLEIESSDKASSWSDTLSHRFSETEGVVDQRRAILIGAGVILVLVVLGMFKKAVTRAR